MAARCPTTHARPARPPCRPRGPQAFAHRVPPRCALAGHGLGERQKARAARRIAPGRARVQLVRALHQQRRRLARRGRSWRCRAPRPRRKLAADPLRTGGSDQTGPNGRASASSASRYTTARCTSHRSNTRRLPVARGHAAAVRPWWYSSKAHGPRKAGAQRLQQVRGRRAEPRRRVGEQRRGEHHHAAAQARERERERATLRVRQQRRAPRRAPRTRARTRARGSRRTRPRAGRAERPTPPRVRVATRRAPAAAAARSSTAFRPSASAARRLAAGSGAARPSTRRRRRRRPAGGA